MKIVIATDAFAPKIDGVATTSAMIARALARRGHAVRVIAPAPGPASIDGCPVRRIHSMPLPFYHEVRLAWDLPAIIRGLRQQPPDAAIALTSGAVGVATTAALPANVPVIHIYTTDMPRYADAYTGGLLRRPAEALSRYLSERAAVTLCPTETVRADLSERGHPRLEVWGRGVDLDLFNPGRRSAAMRLRLTDGEPERPLVLYAGRLAREKRLDDLHIAALRLPDVRFAFVGDGPERARLERLFHGMPAVFTGYLQGPPLAEAIAAADIFAFPSDSDTFGQVVVQAMACGVPPIVVAGSAPAELVPDQTCGRHVPARDPLALAALITELIRDADARMALARAAPTHARRFCWETLADRLEHHLLVGAGPNHDETCR